MNEDFLSEDEVLAEGDDELEYEEITSDEVDRVVGVLEELMEMVDSENIRAFLQDAVDNIYALVYDDESLDDEEALYDEEWDEQPEESLGPADDEPHSEAA